MVRVHGSLIFHPWSSSGFAYLHPLLFPSSPSGSVPCPYCPPGSLGFEKDQARACPHPSGWGTALEHVIRGVSIPIPNDGWRRIFRQAGTERGIPFPSRGFLAPARPPSCGICSRSPHPSRRFSFLILPRGRHPSRRRSDWEGDAWPLGRASLQNEEPTPWHAQH